MTVGARIGSGATFSLTGGGVLHDKATLSAPVRLVGAKPIADPALIRSRFDRSGLTGGMNLPVAGDGPLSLDLGYRGRWASR